jgi:hypothetical protein
MPEWINTKDRMPTRLGKYFVKVNGMRDILHTYDIEKKHDYDYEVFWLDESDLEKKAINQLKSAKSVEEMVSAKYNAGPVSVPVIHKKTNNDVVGAIKTGRSISDHTVYLENLFGVKKGKRIAERFKK